MRMTWSTLIVDAGRRQEERAEKFEAKEVDEVQLG